MENAENEMKADRPEEVEAVGKEETADKKGGLGLSLWTVAILVLLCNGKSLYSSTFSFMGIVAACAMLFVNYSIANGLRDDEQLTEKGKGIWTFNLYAVVAVSIISVIDSFGLAEDNFLTIISGVLGLVILPCYAIAQIIVAVRLMKDRKAVGLGISIIATLIVTAVAAALITDVPHKKSTEGLYFGCFAGVSVVEILMYWAYDKFFKTTEADI